MRYGVFLRAVNVGGRNRLPMAELRSALEAAGFDEVSTWIQSGNIALEAGEMTAAALSDEIQQVIGREFGLELGVVSRSGTELSEIVADGPFREEDPKKVLVVLLGEACDTELDASRFSPDVCELGRDGNEVHVYCPDGFSSSKLTAAWIERQTNRTGTGRNWNTMMRMTAMVNGEI